MKQLFTALFGAGLMLLALAFVPQPASAGPLGCCIGTTGNVDNDPGQLVDIGDLIVLVDHLFITFSPLACDAEADVDGVPGVDIGDVIFLVDNLFISFPPLPACVDSGGGTSEPQPGDLVITEMMIDPAALPDSIGEWFEIANLSARQLDLDGVHFAGTPATDSFTVQGSHPIGQGQFYVFASSFSAVPFPNTVYSKFPLNNGPDKIVMSYKGTLLDSVGWGSAPTGSSRTLRLTAYNRTANDLDSNWCPNIQPMLTGDFGTPGLAGLTFCDFPSSPLVPGSVIFYEFMPRPTETPEPLGEWFELFNPSDTAIYNMKGAVIRKGTDSILITQPLLLFPKTVVLFARDTAAFSGYFYYPYGGSFTLPNTGTTTLTLAVGSTIIDVASYKDPTNGKSRSLNPTKATAAENDVLSNWCDSSTPYGTTDTGTPGADNDLCPM